MFRSFSYSYLSDNKLIEKIQNRRTTWEQPLRGDIKKDDSTNKYITTWKYPRVWEVVLYEMFRSRLFSPVRFYSTTRPLDILFFGSDTFSIHSYKALKQISSQQPNLISKLQLVTRPPKWCGRKKSILKKPAILEYSESQHSNEQPLLCDTRQDMLDTLTPWLTASKNSMMIAVSYGKLIPKELITTANYSLNVHPSLLPRYKGSAPIQHTLLNQDLTTGVSIQTLDPNKFDNGEIIAQTPEIDVQQLLQTQNVERTPGFMTRIMIDQLGIIGAELLSDVIQSQSYVNHKPLPNLYKPSWATTIKTNDKQILWFKHTADYIAKMIGILGPVFTFKKTQLGKVHRSTDSFTEKRVLLHDATPIKRPSQVLEPGQFQFDPIANVIRVGCSENTQLEITRLQFEACAIETSDEFMRKLKKRCGPKAAELTTFN